MINIKQTDVLIVSDWHLGFPGTQTKKINEFLEILIIQPTLKKLILNGDIFDLNWARLEHIIEENISLLKKLVKLNKYGVEIIYTLGNHDPLTPKQINYVYSILNKIGRNNIRILPAYQIQKNNNIFLINHGQMFDIFIAEHKLIAKWSNIGYRITIAFDNLFGIALTEKISYLIRRLTKWSTMYEKRCRRYLQKRKYNAIILGHTHEPKIIEWQLKQKTSFKLTKKISNHLITPPTQEKIKKYYFNSGDWVEPNHCTYIKMDDKGDCTLHYFINQ
jgi:UDP-2,3-diacylglucosamine pyrophosphatase LpxH